MQLRLSKDRSRLYQKCEKFDFENPPYDPIELAESMVKFVYDNNLLGIAYNQLELEGTYAVFAMRAIEKNRQTGEMEDYCIFNPKLIQSSEEEIELEESCASYPNLIIKKKRPRHYRVRFTGPNGETYTQTFANLQARCFLHEYDHISGIPFWDGISHLQFQRAIKKAKKRGYDYTSLTYKGI